MKVLSRVVSDSSGLIQLSTCSSSAFFAKRKRVLVLASRSQAPCDLLEAWKTRCVLESSLQRGAVRKGSVPWTPRRDPES